MKDDKLTCPSCGWVGQVQKISAIFSGERQIARKILLAPPNPPTLKYGALPYIFVIVSFIYYFLNKTSTQVVVGQPNKRMFGGNIFPTEIISKISANTLQSYLNSMSQIDSVGWIFLGILFFLIILMMLLTIRFLITFPSRRAKYGKAMEKWNSLFYCKRCDCVFEAGSSDFTSAQNMKNLLNT